MRSNRLWVIVDQGLYSASNVALTLSLANVLNDRVAFGRFAIAYTVLLILQNLSRSFTGEVLIARTWERWKPDVGNDTAAALGASSGAFLFGICAFVVAIGSSLIGLTPTRFALPLGAAAPFVFAHDALRLYCYGNRRAQLAMASNVIWTLALVLAFGVSMTRTDHAAEILIGGWTIGAMAACALLALRLTRGANPGPIAMATKMWHHASKRVGRFYAAEFLVTRGTVEFVTISTAFFLTPETPGTLRLLQTLYGPLGIIVAGLQASAIAELGRTTVKVARQVRASAVVSAALPVGFFIALVVFSPWLARLIGDSWEPVEELLALGALRRTILGASFIPVVVLRARRELALSVNSRLATGAATVLLAVVGIGIGSAFSVLASLTAASAFGTGVWWRNYRRAISQEPTQVE